MKITARQLVVIVLAALGFGVAMALIGRVPSFAVRLLLAGVAGGLQGLAVMYGFRRRKPS